MHKVDFFIIGAPKCGTDSLRSYLTLCSNVFMSGPKEPNYFCTDIEPPRYSEAEYIRRHFYGAPNSSVWGEKSTWYLASKLAAKNALRHNSNARFVAVIRDHVGMFASLHSELVKLGAEPLRDLEAAWQASFDRDPLKLTGNRWFSCYTHACALGRQIDHWQKSVDKDRFFVTTLERLATNPDELGRICAFLNVCPPVGGGLPHENQAQGPRNALGHLLSPGPQITRLSDEIKIRLNIRSLGIGNILLKMRKRWGADQFVRPVVSEKLRDSILDFFSDDIRLLAHFLNDNGRNRESNGRA